MLIAHQFQKSKNTAKAINKSKIPANIEYETAVRTVLEAKQVTCSEQIYIEQPLHSYMKRQREY